MKRFLLLGILLFSYTFSFSQKILKPTRNPSIVCVETEMQIKFVIKGDFGTGSKFEVFISDTSNDFSNAIKIGSTPYIAGQYSYSGMYSVSGVPVDKYYIKIVSTDPSTVESPTSKRFSVVENDPVAIVADGPTEFCEGGGVDLVTELSFDNRSLEWYRVASPNDEYLGSYQEFRAEKSGTYFAVSVVGSCVEKSNEITVVETTAPVSLITEVDQEVCYPDPGVFTAASTNVENPYYEWLDENGEVKKVGNTFSTNIAGTYYLRTTNYGNISEGGGCEDVSGPVTLIVHDFEADILEIGPIEACSGTEIILNSSEANPDYIYNWKRNGVVLPDPISGKGKTSYIFISQETDSGNYTLEIVSPVCVKESSPSLEIDIKDSPTPAIVEVDQKGCEGSTVTLTSGFDDLNNDYNYQWYLGTNPVSGANSKTLDVIISTSTQGDYYLEMSFANCTVKSLPSNVKLVKTPVSLIYPEGEAIACEGEQITLAAISENTEIATYSWIDSNDVEVGTEIEFITSTPGNYRLVTLNDGVCSNTSPVTTVIISPIPESKIKNTSLLDCELVVLEAESDLKGAEQDRVIYRWFKDDILVPIQEGVNPILNVSESGDYKLETLNYGLCGDITAPVTVIIHDIDPSINESADPVLVCVGSEHTLTAVETDPTYTYIWSRELVGSGSQEELQNSNSPSYIIKGVTADVGEWDYTLRVISPSCDKTSDAVSVVFYPLAESKIKDTSFLDCEKVVLEAESDLHGGDADKVIYRWFKDDIVTPIQEGNNPVLNVTESGDYKLETLNYGLCGDITAPVTVIINDLDPSINESTNPVLVCVGSEHTLTAVETDPTYTYIWSRELVGSGSQEELQNSSSPSYIIKGVIADVGEWDYTLRVISPSCDKTSDAVSVVFYPLAESKIKDTSFLDCEKVVLEAESDLHGGDADKVIYRWFKDDIVTPIQEGNNSVLNVYESGDYKLETLNYGLCGDITAPVTVVINDLDPSIDETADPVLVCVDSEHTLIAVETDLTYTYIWYRELVGSGSQEELQNSNSPSYIIKGVSADVGEWDYTLRVISPECDKISDAINVVIPVTPIAEISPDVDQTVCADVILKSVGVNTGSNITYKWFKDGSEISSATDVEYTVTEQGDYFFKVYNYDVCESISKTINISFVDFEHGIVEGDIIKECEEAGQFLQLTSINTDTKYTYKWFKGTQEVGNTMVLDIERLKENGGLYTLEVTEGSCSKMSDPIDVVILPTPVSLITDSPSEYCDGDSFTISSKENNTDYDYAWFYNDVEITSSTSGGLFENFDTPTLIGVMDNSTVGDYQVMVSVGNCGGSISPKVNMGMHDKFNIYVDAYPGTVLCPNGSINLTVTASVNISKYTWLKNGSAISGEDESNFDATSPGTYVVVLESEVTGCSQPSDEIVISPAPNMGVVEDVIYVNNGETAIFEGFGGDSYKWFDDNGNLLQDGGVTFEVKVDDNTSYELEVSNEYCTSDLIKLLVVVKGITADDIQNMMTPNGDGFNDVWKLPSGFVSDGDEVVILNRQGSIVYRSNNYRDDWGGTLNDGPALPAATYYYVIRRKGKEPIMGSVMIFR